MSKDEKNISDLDVNTEVQESPAPAEDLYNGQMHEDAARFIRQRLLALEEGREDDAQALKEFILEEFGEAIADVDVADVPEELRGRWAEYYGLPESIEKVTVLVNHAREPVWRFVDDRETRSVSVYEVPSHLMPKYDFLAEEPDLSKLQRHLWPRQDGELPPHIAELIRPVGYEPKLA